MSILKNRIHDLNFVGIKFKGISHYTNLDISYIGRSENTKSRDNK